MEKIEAFFAKVKADIVGFMTLGVGKAAIPAAESVAEVALGISSDSAAAIIKAGADALLAMENLYAAVKAAEAAKAAAAQPQAPAA